MNGVRKKEKAARVKKREAKKTARKAARWPCRTRRARNLLRRFGLDQVEKDPTFTSTAQAQCLNPARVSASNPVYGPLMGRNLTDGTPWYHDAHEFYRQGLISGPNAVIVGGYGLGKSSCAKTVYGTRALACGRRVVVFDRKRQQSGKTVGGEYLRLAKTVGGAVISLDRRPGFGTRVNILDPAISVEGSVDTMVGQDELLMMVAAAACGEELHDTAGHAPAFALRAAHKAALETAHRQNRVAVLSDVVNALYQPSADAIPGPRDGNRPLLEAQGIVTQDDLRRWGLPVAMNLERFLNGEWSGLLDGETQAPDGSPVDLSAQLIVIDTSALPEDSSLLGLMMAIMATWLNAKFTQMRGPKILIQEEAYALDRLALAPGIFRALAKRGRSSGLVLVTLIHHLSDLQPDSDLWALVRETEIVHLFRQDKQSDAEQAIEFFNLPAWCRRDLSTLDKGVQIVKVGTQLPVVVQHVLTRDEGPLIDTDEAMTVSAEPAPFSQTKVSTDV